MSRNVPHSCKNPVVYEMLHSFVKVLHESMRMRRPWLCGEQKKIRSTIAGCPSRWPAQTAI